MGDRNQSKAGSEDSIPNELMQQHVSSEVAYVYVLSSDDLIGVDKTDEILSKIGVPRSYIKDPTAWVSAVFFDLLLGYFDKFGSSEKLAKNTGKFLSEIISNGFRYRFFKSFDSHLKIFRDMSKGFRNINITRRYELTEVSRNHVILKVFAPDRAVVPTRREVCYAWTEIFHHINMIFTGNPGKVIKTSCIYDGDESCTYNILWKHSFKKILQKNELKILFLVCFTSQFVLYFWSVPKLHSFAISSISIFWLSFYLFRQISNLRKFEKEIVKNYESMDNKYAELIREKRSVDNKVFEKTKELRIALDELKLKEAALIHKSNEEQLGRISATISHEIGNAIFSIENSIYPIDTAVSTCDDKRAKEDADSAIHQIKTSLKIISDIIGSIKINSGRQKIEYIPIKLKEIIDSVIAITRHLMISRNIEIKELLSETDTVLGDPGSLHRIFTSIIVNGIDAMPQGGILTISSKDKKDFYQVSIADTGEGIPLDLQKKVFDIFFTTKPVGKGTGLGLHLAKQEILKHNGNIEFSSTPGKGTKFYISIPKKANLNRDDI